ncbi:hypothetical protein B0H13DRAFT_2350488 [Mycena leptocephala]|nr:hypothetical protein B0H13DRAFT_2350488 [Mycena leptocephala]
MSEIENSEEYKSVLEDGGAFIGQIFSDIDSRNRVGEFLRVFEKRRQRRCAQINELEKQYINEMTLSDGDLQVQRDTSMRENLAAGRNVMDSGRNIQQM